MVTFRKFPSIVQYANVVKQVRDYCNYHALPLPILNFTGSVKKHGTNGGIGYSTNGDIWFQSRERLLSYESDNAGFCTWGEQNLEILREIYNIVFSENNLEHDAFYIFGEWCGSSIQKGVALNQLREKKFGIFEMVFVKGEETFKIDPRDYHLRINTLLSNVFVTDYIVPPLELTIDFSVPHLVQNFLMEETTKVGDECPVGKYFGVSGIGEGLVWQTGDVDWLPLFKTKDERHSVSKVKTVHELTDAEIASKANATEFVEYACTENRLKQGIDKLGEMGLGVDIKSMGSFLKWVGGDILSECKDVLLASGIDRKDVMPRVADKARNWFLTYLNSEIGLGESQ
jgi:RNA ligase